WVERSVRGAASFPRRRSSDLAQQRAAVCGHPLGRPRRIPDILYDDAIDTRLREQARADVLYNELHARTRRRRERHIDLGRAVIEDRKSTRLNSSHVKISYADF